MSFLYYFQNCPTCKNHERNLVREVALQQNVEVDERYTLVLPDIWGKAAEKIGTLLPFLYDTTSGQSLHIEAGEEGMARKIRAFLETNS